MLEISGLEAGYGDSRVLRGLELSVGGGEMLALLGRNGMGKTTLLRTLMGLLPARAGAIRFEGRDIAGLKPFEIARLGIGYVPQGREIFADFSVEENLVIGQLGHSRLRDGAIPPAIFEDFPILAERRRQRAGTLSGGQQQQLAIARALIAEPRLLLLDEPSEGIQPSIVDEIAETLAEISRARGLTLVLVEQNVEMALDLADRCAFLENGRIVEQGPAEAVRRDQALLHRYLAL